MTLSKHLILLFLLVVIQHSLSSSVIVKKNNNVGVTNSNHSNGWVPEGNLFGETEERNLEQEILKELNHLSPRKQKEILDDLEKQQEKFNTSRKSLVLSETENLSPINLEELKSVRKKIKASNSTLPAIRNKRTLNFLLLAIARAMGYSLALTNPNAEWIPRQQPTSPQSCTTPPPPCSPNPPSTPPPCAMPPTTPPCPGSSTFIKPATIPPDQINANTISYPYRPARTIPLFNFAPLPAGMRVLYPPLLQSPSQQRSPCTTQQPPPPPCCATPPPSSVPCGTTPPRAPPSCKPTPAPPCSAPPAPPPPPCKPTPAPPCSTTPAPPPPPCKPTPAPPCSTTPAPPPPPCKPTPAPPCSSTPAPPPPPCSSTPAPPSQPCKPTSAPPCVTSQAPCPPPCATPVTPSCGNPQPPPPPPPPPPPSPSEPSKRGSILLEYDDPVRIQIFSNDKKYLPASGSVYSGHDDDSKEDWHSYFFPDTEKSSKKDEEFEEIEEEQVEQLEDEEKDEDEKASKQLKHYEEEDEKTLENKEEEEEDESETNLSIVKKPVNEDVQKANKHRPVTTKTQTSVSDNKNKKNEKEDSKYEKSEKSQKVKKPKRKKWIRIIKKHKKTKTDLNPQNHYETYTSDTFPEASRVAPKYYGKRGSQLAFDSFEKDVSDFSDDSSSRSSEDVMKIDLKKVVINNKDLNSAEPIRDDRAYEFNFNPFVLEPEEQRRKKLEKAVERYVEDYVEKQLGDELIKNTGIPKTTVFEFASKNGPKIQTITTTVAKTSHNKNLSSFKPQIRPEIRANYKHHAGNAHSLKSNDYGENFKKRGNFVTELFPPVNKLHNY